MAEGGIKNKMLEVFLLSGRAHLATTGGKNEPVNIISHSRP